MIEYLEIRNSSFSLLDIIDSANSIIWHSVYFGVGDFEIYATASSKHLNLLQKGYYVTRPEERNGEVYQHIGIIENVNVTYNVHDGRMITATGRFAKSILNRRQIYNLSGKTNKATTLTGNVENAARTLVTNNVISCSFNSNRNISILELGTHSGSTKTIVDSSGNATRKQVSFDNLLTYSDSLLEEYGMSANVNFDADTNKLKYVIYEGADRSIDNTASNAPVVFGIEFDNLTNSDYKSDNTNLKTAILIGGEGEGLNRFYSMIEGTETGINRRETWLDASSISKTYEEDGEEAEYTDAEYKAMLDSKGKQTLAAMLDIESFDGSLNVTGGVYRFNDDYKLGDIVTIQDNILGKYINARITEVIEIQDEAGYTVEVSYQN